MAANTTTISRSPHKVADKIEKTRSEVPIVNRVKTRTIDMTGPLRNPLDRTKPLDDAQRASFREQRLAILEYVKGKDEYTFVLPDDDDLSILDPKEQWSKVEELDSAAVAAQPNPDTLKEMVMLARKPAAENSEVPVSSNAHISNASTSSDAAMGAAPGSATTEAKAPEASPPPPVKVEDAEKQRIAEEAEQKRIAAEKEARAAAIKEAKEIAERAQKNLEAMQQRAKIDFPDMNGPAVPQRQIVEDDYRSDTDNEPPEDITQRDLRNMRNELRATTQGTITSHAMIGDLSTQLLSSLLVFLPQDWTPRQLITELISIRNAGWFERLGFAGIAQKGTPIRVKLETEQDAETVADVIYRWSDGYITTALDSPSECSRQKAQARDMLRYCIELEKSRVRRLQQSGAADGEIYEHRYSVQWPKSRLRRKTREGTYDSEPCADFWTILEWQPDGKFVVVARGEYDHSLLEQTILMSIPKLIGYDVTRTEFQTQIKDRLLEYYTNQFQYERTLSPLQRDIALQVKSEESEEQPPPRQQIADGVIDPVTPQPPKGKGDKSGKGSKQKGGKNGKQKGKSKSWYGGGKNNNWSYSDPWTNYRKSGSKGAKPSRGKSKGAGKSYGKQNQQYPQQINASYDQRLGGHKRAAENFDAY